MPAASPRSAAQPIRVLCVTPVGPSGKGGIDRLYGYLRAAGRPEPGDAIVLRYVASRGDLDGWRWLPVFPYNALRFLGLLASFRPHVVHLNFATGGSIGRKYVLALLSRLARRRVVLHFHGDFPEAAISAGRIEGRLFIALSRLAHRVIALGPVTRERFVRLAGLPEAAIRVVPNGIRDFAPSRTRKGDGATRILFAGEVGERKGVSVLLEALGVLSPSGAWHCTIAGNGELARYQDQARRLRIGASVRFTGWLPASEVHALMGEADIVILPSEAENMPLALIEGACAGASLVATPVAETRAVLRDGENGLVVSRDPAEIASALTRLIEDRETLRRMQARSRKIFEENFTVEAFADGLFAAYRDACGR